MEKKILVSFSFNYGRLKCNFKGRLHAPSNWSQSRKTSLKFCERIKKGGKWFFVLVSQAHTFTALLYWGFSDPIFVLKASKCFAFVLTRKENSGILMSCYMQIKLGRKQRSLDGIIPRFSTIILFCRYYIFYCGLEAQVTGRKNVYKLLSTPICDLPALSSSPHYCQPHVGSDTSKAPSAHHLWHWCSSRLKLHYFPSGSAFAFCFHVCWVSLEHCLIYTRVS